MVNRVLVRNGFSLRDLDGRDYYEVLWYAVSLAEAEEADTLNALATQTGGLAVAVDQGE